MNEKQLQTAVWLLQRRKTSLVLLEGLDKTQAEDHALSKVDSDVLLYIDPKRAVECLRPLLENKLIEIEAALKDLGVEV